MVTFAFFGTLKRSSVLLKRYLVFHRLFFLLQGNQTTLVILRHEILGLCCLLKDRDGLVALEGPNSLLMDDWLGIHHYTVMISLLKVLLLHSF
jgi:hypothetical protein